MILPQSPPHLEKIEPQFGSSFTYYMFEESAPKAAPTWHFHPELQIAYVAEGSGKRHIGNHISYFKRGTLVMIGPNLPHYGIIDRVTNNASEVVVQMKADFLGQPFLELPETKHKLDLLYYDFLHKRNLLFGTPEYVVNKINELQSELNLQNLQVWSNFPGIDHEACMRSIKLFNDEVIPKINLDTSNLERAS